MDPLTAARARHPSRAGAPAVVFEDPRRPFRGSYKRHKRYKSIGLHLFLYIFRKDVSFQDFASYLQLWWERGDYVLIIYMPCFIFKAWSSYSLSNKYVVHLFSHNVAKAICDHFQRSDLSEHFIQGYFSPNVCLHKDWQTICFRIRVRGRILFLLTNLCVLRTFHHLLVSTAVDITVQGILTYIRISFNLVF